MNQTFKKLFLVPALTFTLALTFCACGASKEAEKAADVNTATKTTDACTTTTTEKVPTTEEKPMLTTAENKELTVNCDSTNASGKLLTVCAATSAGGQNQSPAVSWNEVSGAKSYAVYMIDTSAGNWMHWRAYNITNTSLEQGGTPSESEYKGPYPPSGIHNYVIYVFALLNDADSYPGNFDSKNSDISSIKSKLDISGGKSGNVLASGSVKTIYAHGDNNV